MQPSHAPIKLFGMDIDGVLTEGGICYGDGGLEIKRFHAHDGMGLSLLGMAGLVTFIITGRTSEAVARRGRELGVTEVHQGVADKLACLEAMLPKYGASLEEVVYVGDDLPDLAVMLRVGFPIAPADARDEVKRIARVVTAAPGGHGALREAAEWALRHNGQWEALLASFKSPPEGKKLRG
ncbi:MAG TPA: HAD-IIIA family hydrolase [bacterium]|nr:HAD-IIIA family hydrolase [bacterium]